MKLPLTIRAVKIGHQVGLLCHSGSGRVGFMSGFFPISDTSRIRVQDTHFVISVLGNFVNCFLMFVDRRLLGCINRVEQGWQPLHNVTEALIALSQCTTISLCIVESGFVMPEK